jgi:hypothetical protein
MSKGNEMSMFKRHLQSSVICDNIDGIENILLGEISQVQKQKQNKTKKNGLISVLLGI